LAKATAVTAKTSTNAKAAAGARRSAGLNTVVDNMAVPPLDMHEREVNDLARNKNDTIDRVGE
jgi:hypothetical protein